jgi:hypothetical protein
MDDIKKRAEQYAHSYPFAKVADAYEAGALAERERRNATNGWHDATKVQPPIFGGKVLVKIGGVPFLGRRFEDGSWTSNSSTLRFNDAEIDGWREIE